MERKKVRFREIFLSDLQIPFQDDKAVEVMFEIARDFKPDLIWLGGDVIDSYSLSGYVKSNLVNFEDEVELTKDFLNRLRKIFPNAEIIYQEGNHEMRFRNYILRKAEQLEFLLNRKIFGFEELLELDKLKIKYIIGPALVGKLYHIHGHERKTTGQLVHVALNYVRWLHKSVVFGHWHVLQKFPIKEIDGSYKEAYANPCLFDIAKMPYGGYTTIDLFHRGFSLISYFDEDYFHVDQILLLESGNHYLCYYKDELLKFERGANHNNLKYKITFKNEGKRTAKAGK